MQCDQNPNTLASYLDGELTPSELVTVQEHIRSCPQCAIEIAELARLKRSLRPARNHFAPTAEFRKKMQQQLSQIKTAQQPVVQTPPTQAQPVPTKPRPKSALRFLPAAFALAAMLLLTFGWLQYSRRADAFPEVADLHVNALASANPLDVISTDRHTVKPWFQGRIPFSFNVPELAGTGFTLLGGRMVYLHQQPGAQLIVANGLHKISVLIFQGSSALTRELPNSNGAQHHNSFSVEAWQQQGLQFVVIGDTDPAAIDKLSQSLKQAN